MKQSTFVKELEVKGSIRVVKAIIQVTMNDGKEGVRSTSGNGDTHRMFWVHKIEVSIEGEMWKKISGIDSELEVFKVSERIIRETFEYITALAEVTEVPTQSFSDKMQDLFSKY